MILSSDGARRIVIGKGIIDQIQLVMRILHS